VQGSAEHDGSGGAPEVAPEAGIPAPPLARAAGADQAVPGRTPDSGVSPVFQRAEARDSAPAGPPVGLAAVPGDGRGSPEGGRDLEVQRSRVVEGLCPLPMFGRGLFRRLGDGRRRAKTRTRERSRNRPAPSGRPRRGPGSEGAEASKEPLANSP